MALVKWTNPDDAYKDAIEVIEDPESIQKYGWRQTEIDAIGCMSRGQAYCLGKWLLDTEITQTETATYRASFDNFDLTPSDIIKIADPAYEGARNGGRLLYATTLSVTLDAPVLLGDGIYTLSVMLPDGTIVDRPLTNLSGSASVFTFDAPLPDVPKAGAMWIVSGGEVEPRQFRVLSVAEVEPNIVEVTALFP